MCDTNFDKYNNKKPYNNRLIPKKQFLSSFLVHNWYKVRQIYYHRCNIDTCHFNWIGILGNYTPFTQTSFRKSLKNYEKTSDFLSKIKNRNCNYYTDKNTIDKIGQIEARGEDFSLLSKKIMSSRASTEGGTSIVYKYSDSQGTKYLIHEVTDSNGVILHRDFDAVRIASGQLLNKGH
ncbi:MAG: hypothetical protein IJA34_16195 [Lachnospiraceae bacterium]|nr:hypothetical protein [Lachnospiraceae bacterium]